jgi:hypothetical protein
MQMSKLIQLNLLAIALLISACGKGFQSSPIALVLPITPRIFTFLAIALPTVVQVPLTIAFLSATLKLPLRP